MPRAIVLEPVFIKDQSPFVEAVRRAANVGATCNAHEPLAGAKEIPMAQAASRLSVSFLSVEQVANHQRLDR
jgi:hypothetical protein